MARWHGGAWQGIIAGCSLGAMCGCHVWVPCLGAVCGCHVWVPCMGGVPMGAMARYIMFHPWIIAVYMVVFLAVLKFGRQVHNVKEQKRHRNSTPKGFKMAFIQPSWCFPGSGLLFHVFHQQSFDGFSKMTFQTQAPASVWLQNAFSTSPPSPIICSDS